LTLGQDQIATRLGAGVGISVLLHALMIMAAFFWLRASTPAQPSYYRIRLVDIPAPSPKKAMPEKPSALEVPRPTAPGKKAPEAFPERQGSAQADRQTIGPTAFYDREAIESTASSSAREKAKKEDGVTFDTRDMMYRGYLDMLRQKVESVWQYPRKAAQDGIYGDLVIRFIILKDGSLGEVKVLRTSGHRMLDTAAVEALRDGVPYWPLPEGWDRQSLPITGRFIYNIRGGYIR